MFIIRVLIGILSFIAGLFIVNPKQQDITIKSASKMSQKTKKKMLENYVNEK